MSPAVSVWGTSVAAVAGAAGGITRTPKKLSAVPAALLASTDTTATPGAIPVIDTTEPVTDKRTLPPPIGALAP